MFARFQLQLQQLFDWNLRMYQLIVGIQTNLATGPLIQWDQCTLDNLEASNNLPKNKFYIF